MVAWSRGWAGRGGGWFRHRETFRGDVCVHRASLIAQLVKNPPAMQETLIWFLGREDRPEKGQATPSSILGLSCGSAGKESA